VEAFESFRLAFARLS